MYNMTTWNAFQSCGHGQVVSGRLNYTYRGMSTYCKIYEPLRNCTLCDSTLGPFRGHSTTTTFRLPLLVLLPTTYLPYLPTISQHFSLKSISVDLQNTNGFTFTVENMADNKAKYRTEIQQVSAGSHSLLSCNKSYEDTEDTRLGRLQKFGSDDMTSARKPSENGYCVFSWSPDQRDDTRIVRGWNSSNKSFRS